MQITINEWEEYQPRKDLKSLTWFRLDVDFLESESFYDLKPAEIVAWLKLLTLCAKSNNPTIKKGEKYLTHCLKLTTPRMIEVLEILEDKGLITVDAAPHPYKSVQIRTDLCSTDITNKQTNITDKTDEQDSMAVQQKKNQETLDALSKELDI